MKFEIAIEIDDGRVTSYSNSHLALLWHVAQANPADQFEDQAAGELVERIGREIIRRWLKAAEPELYHHQGRHYFWKQLYKFARYQPGAADPSSPEWHAGVWVPRAADESAEPGEGGGHA
jgi:hypothetical protein